LNKAVLSNFTLLSSTGINELDHEIADIATHDLAAIRLQELRGVGPMVATALLAARGCQVSSPTLGSLLPHRD
jgi:hypothetical protein